MSLVLDCSVTMAWIYSDETTPFVTTVFEQVVEDGAWVPGLWRLEVANVLQMSVRRLRHNAAFREATLADLVLLPIQIDAETNDNAWTSTVYLADRHSLTTYDAAYLELAIRRSLPLATLDGDLRTAALAEGVTLPG